MRQTLVAIETSVWDGTTTHLERASASHSQHAPANLAVDLIGAEAAFEMDVVHSCPEPVDQRPFDGAPVVGQQQIGLQRAQLAMNLAQRRKRFSLVDFGIDDGGVEPPIKPIARRIGAVER